VGIMSGMVEEEEGSLGILPPVIPANAGIHCTADGVDVVTAGALQRWIPARAKPGLS